MGLELEIEGIRERVKAGHFANKAAVSQEIVLRPLEGDFALCPPAEKPKALIEVKRIGESDRAERQLSSMPSTTVSR